MADSSPPKWHLAHTSWFFETFLLKPTLSDYTVFHEQFEYLFNSYYNGIGQPYPRANRGFLSRPTVTEVLAYRRHVDEHMQALLSDAGDSLRERIILGLHHEQQHQELLVMDIKYNFGNNPLFPAYRDQTQQAADRLRLSHSSTQAERPMAFSEFSGGLVSVGAAGEQFCFDNELPRHSVFLPPFALANRVISNAEYQQFMVDGGYLTPGLWLSDGWSWLQQSPQIRAPAYWLERDGQWFEYTLRGLQPLHGSDPVCHVSFYEAEAFARWHGARLPTEAEWESVSESVETVGGNFVDTGSLHPQPARDEPGLQQMFGDVWEWTVSAYGPYPGFAPAAGAIGEYNGKFMSNQRVLKGGSCATPPGHIRSSYRNFFYPPDRWQFSGIRLARDLDSA
jgi:ergothioneine biosynthesis protein EgtB